VSSRFWIGSGVLSSAPLRPSFLTFTGQPILIDSGPGVYSGTFSLVGSLCGGIPIPLNQTPPPCNPDLPTLTGSGLIALTMGPQPTFPGGPELLYFVRSTYTFVEPVPEPATGPLTGLALAVLGLFCKLKTHPEKGGACNAVRPRVSVISGRSI
jgi:hypothetical protein